MLSSLGAIPAALQGPAPTLLSSLGSYTTLACVVSAYPRVALSSPHQGSPEKIGCHLQCGERLLAGSLVEVAEILLGDHVSGCFILQFPSTELLLFRCGPNCSVGASLPKRSTAATTTLWSESALTGRVGLGMTTTLDTLLRCACLVKM